MSTLALFALAAGAAAACPCAGDWPLAEFTRERCPQVFRIRGTTPVEQALNIVVISDAFTAAELDAFRCAAGLTFEKLAATPPFHEYSDSINVFRIDLASTTSGVEFPASCGVNSMHCPASAPRWPNRDCQCRTLAERSGFASPARGAPQLAGEHPACLELDLDVHACPANAAECQLLWPEGDGIRKLSRVAACAPAVDLVVILANSGASAGGGSEDTNPPVSVATLLQIGEWTHRARLLTHELGHSLGLLDEYAASTAFSGESKTLPPFHDGRNVVRIQAPGALPRDVPWESLCTPGVAGLERYAAGKCFTVCGPHCERDCDLPSLPEQPVVGLFEGGFYESCTHFRPSQNCKMQDYNDDFCPACQFYLRGLLEDLGLKPNAHGPADTDDPDPACPLDPRPPG